MRQFIAFFRRLWAMFHVKRRLDPQTRTLLQSALETIDRLAEERALWRSMAQSSSEEARRDRYRTEWVEAQTMGGAGPWQPVTEAQRGERETVVKERLAELELGLEDRGWKRQLAWADTEFSRWGIQQIMLICRLYKVKNPLVRRAVKVTADYVFGRGISVTCDDPKRNDVLQAFMERNKKELSVLGLTQKQESLLTDGNLFFAIFPDISTGEVEVRMIDPTEIQEIVTDPDDASRPLFFHRAWSADQFDVNTGVRQWTRKELWYRALGSCEDFKPTDKLTQINGKPIAKTKSGQWVWVLHLKMGGEPKWHFGCPPIYNILDWTRAITHFLEDWASIQRALARFAWNVETQGGAPAIAGLKTALATTLASDGQQIETNPPPVVGSAFITGPGNKLTPVKTAGMQTGPEECRRMVLMVCAGTDLPETFFGDTSTGSLATAQSLDRPTELKFMLLQELWKYILMELLQAQMYFAGASVKGKLYEAKKAGAQQQYTIDIKFPAVLEHDINARVGAIVDAMTLGSTQGQVCGLDEKTGILLLLTELGVDDPEILIEEMYPDATYEPDRQKQQDAQDAKDMATQQMQNKHALAMAKAGAVPNNAPRGNGPEPNAPQPTTPKNSKEARADRLDRAVNQLKELARRMEAVK